MPDVPRTKYGSGLSTPSTATVRLRARHEYQQFARAVQRMSTSLSRELLEARSPTRRTCWLCAVRATVGYMRTRFRLGRWGC